MTTSEDNEADGVGSARWWRQRQQSIEPARPQLSRQTIAEAALRLVDAEGLDELSMRRLGGELKVSAASIYRYFASKEDLTVEIVDLLIGAVEPAAALGSDDWRDEVGNYARSLRKGLLDHPKVTPLLINGHMLGPNALLRRERGLRFFLNQGFTPREACATYLSIAHFVFGFVLQEAGEFFRSPDQREHLRQFFDELDPETFPTVRAVADEMCALDTDEEFEFALTALLGGIGHTIRGTDGALAPVL